MAIATQTNVDPALNLLFNDGQVVEVRVITPQGILSGYFTDFDKVAETATKMDRQGSVYVTLNEIKPDSINNKQKTNRWNRIAPCPAGGATAAADIKRRRWFLVDCDPVRQGVESQTVSSTEEEHHAALERAKQIKDFLVNDLGWPEPVVADSGNGAHLLFPIDISEVDDSRDTNKELIDNCLRALSFMFDDDQVRIDQGMGKAAQLVKLYGVTAVKGEDTPDRPHRRSKLIHTPASVCDSVVSREQLEELASYAPETPKSSKEEVYFDNSFDVEKYLNEHNLAVHQKKKWKYDQDKEATVLVLATCPFNPGHDNHSAFVIQFDNGGVCVGCHHNSCGTGRNRWRDLRDICEPGWRDRIKESKPNCQAKRLPKVDFAKLGQGEPQKELESLPLLGQPGYIVKGFSHILAGYPKSGKTELLFACVMKWIDKGSRVLWISEEEQLVWHYRKKLCPNLPEEGIFNLVFGMGEDPSALLETARAADENVVIVDTMRSLLGIRDENNNAEISAVLKIWLGALKGRTLIFLHHFRKMTGDSGHAVAGGAAFLGGVDRCIELSKDPHANNRRKLTVLSRIITPPDLLYEMRGDRTLVVLGDPKVVQLKEVMENVIEVLDEHWRKAAEVYDRLGEPKPSLGQTKNALNLALKEGLVHRDPREDRKGATYKWRLKERT